MKKISLMVVLTLLLSACDMEKFNSTDSGLAFVVGCLVMSAGMLIEIAVDKIKDKLEKRKEK